MHAELLVVGYWRGERKRCEARMEHHPEFGSHVIHERLKLSNLDDSQLPVIVLKGLELRQFFVDVMGRTRAGTGILDKSSRNPLVYGSRQTVYGSECSSWQLCCGNLGLLAGLRQLEELAF